MILWIIATAILLWLAGGAGWLWLCAGWRHQGLRGRAGRIALQLSGFALLAGCLAGSPLIALAGAAFPPSALLLLDRILRAPALAMAMGPWALGAFLAIGAIAWIVLRRRGNSGVWALGIGLLAGTLAMMVSGEVTSRRAMCAEAAQHGAKVILRNSFSWSLRHPRRAFNFEVHGLLERAGVARTWSYRQMEWVELAPSIRSNIDAPPHRLPCG